MKDILKKLEYSTANPTPGPATWVEIPITKILAQNATLFAETAALADLIAGAKIGAAVDGNAKYPVILDPGASYLDALETALNAGEPVWVRETLHGGHTFVIGGETGLSGSVSLGRGGRGGFVMKLVDVYATGAETGDTYTITAGA